MSECVDEYMEWYGSWTFPFGDLNFFIYRYQFDFSLLFILIVQTIFNY